MRKKDSYTFSFGKKQQFLNIVSALLSFAVGFGISFFLSPFLLETLGREAYSFYPLSTNITNALTVVPSAINFMACRYITVALVGGKSDDANKYYVSTLFVDFIYSLLLAVFSIVFILFVGDFLKIPAGLFVPVRLLFSFTSASAIVNIFSSIFGVATFATNRIELQSAREISAALLRAVLFLVLYNVFPSNLYYIGVVTLAVSLLGLMMQYIFTKKLLPGISFSRNNISKKHAKEILVSSLWVAVNSIGNIFLTNMTLIVLNRFYGPEICSHVSLAMTISTLISGVITSIIGIFFPIITKDYADSNFAEMRKNIRKTQLFCGVLGCAVIAVLLAFSQAFFHLWVPTENSSLLSDLCFFTLAPYVSIAFFWVATYVNTATNDLKIPALVMLFSGIANIGTQFLLAFFQVDYRWVVAACSIIQSLVVGVFMPLYMAKTTKAKWYEYFGIPLKILVITLVVYILSSCVANMFDIDSWLKFIVIGGGTGILSLALYMLGLLVMKKGWLASVWQIRK